MQFIRPLCIKTDNSKRNNVFQHSPIGSTQNFVPRRTYAQIKLKREKKAPTKPLKFDYSGDLVEHQPLDLQKKLYKFSDIKELEDAPENVQRLCSLQYFDGKERMKHRQYEMKEQIESVCGPGRHWEKEVAKMTVVIRNMMPHCLQFRKDKRSKSQLIEKIAMRKKMLKYLRRDDYERFIWLLKELKIRYVPSPPYMGRVTRRAQRKRDARENAIELQNRKIADLMEKFEKEKVEFYKYKTETLKEIEEDIEKYSLDRASIIKSVQMKLSEKESS
ncbi:hypothetical protein ScPMuIL_012129 [Solemya velum]